LKQFIRQREKEMRLVAAAIFTALMCTGSLADTGLEGTYFRWVDTGSAGCRILGTTDFRGPIVLGKKTRIVVAVGSSKACPKEVTAGGRTLKVRRYDDFKAERLQFKAWNKKGAYRLVWRESPGKYRVASKSAS
jgi:hypothetical protein